MSSMAKVKIAGTWAGVLEVELENWTVPMLREEVAKRSNMVPVSINLICAGKVLKDGDGSERLGQIGIKNNSKVLATRVSIDEGKSIKQEFVAEEERSRRLSRVKAAATALSQRHAEGSLPVEDFEIQLEDQSGQKMHFSENDQQAIMMGLMLHANGKRLIRRQMFKDALEVLTMGEEAFSLCNPKTIELVDNIPILQIDIVWCYFMLQDMAWLSAAGRRLEMAREGLERCHGKDSSRFKLLQGGRSSDIALHLRLELLEGVVAYHSGQFDKCRKFLISAQAKFLQLQVPDDALSIVMGMGFQEQDAKRALRMSNQDVESAINFLVEEKEKKAQKREENLNRQAEILEQKKYGVTPLKKVVDLQRLRELASIGFEKELAAEALRRNENDFQKALDNLTNPETNAAIQHDVESRKRKRHKARDAKIEQVVSMGFERSRVVEAVRAGGSLEQVMHQLLQHRPNSTAAVNNDASASDSATIAANNNPITPDSTPTNADMGSAGSDGFDSDDNFGGASGREIKQRDVEMEDEITEEIKGDALSDYDIEVTREGEAINEYLALLCSNERASSSQ